MGNFAENLNLGNRFRAPPANFNTLESSLYWKSGSTLLEIREYAFNSFTSKSKA